MKNLIVYFVLLLVGWLSAARLSAEVVESVYYVVSGDPITKIDFDNALRDTKRFANEGSQESLELSNSVASNLILQTLLLQETTKKNVVVTADDVENQLQRIMEENNIKNEEDLTKALIAQGIGLEALKKQIRQTLLFQNYVKEELQLIPPTKKQVNDYLKNNPEQFNIKDPVIKLHALRISLKKNMGFTALKNEQKKMEKVIDLFQSKGATVEVFKNLASRESGLLYANIGWALPSSLNISKEQWVELAKLEKNEISSVLRIGDSLIFFLVEEVKRSGTIPDELSYKIVENKIAELARASAMEKIIKRLFATAVVEKKTELLTFIP